jgi:hypothetical protein
MMTVLYCMLDFYSTRLAISLSVRPFMSRTPQAKPGTMGLYLIEHASPTPQLHTS